MEIATQHRSDAKRAKESFTHASATRRLYASGRAQHEAPILVYIERAKHSVELLPVEVVEVRKIGSRKHRDTFKHGNQAGCFPIGQRLDQSGIYKGENGHAGADPELEHEDSGAGEA